MALINRVAAFQDRMVQWRHDLHAHPETAFEERRTGRLVADTLRSLGIEVHEGLAGTGVVGTLRGALGEGEGEAIGLRADMDALHLAEKNTFSHASTVPGKMHGCGHDGHTAMLLGAAAYLAETRNFAGRVHFIFQPAEENEGGGRVMVEEGLFRQFPVRAVFGMHNWPGLPAGTFAIRPGPMMAAYDMFEMNITGRGSHGAMPHQSVDPVTIAAQVVLALQTIVSRKVSPLDAAVLSVTRIKGGDTWNVVPDDVMLGGTVRTFRREVQDFIEAEVGRIGKGIAEAHGARMQLRYERRYPATINTESESALAASVAAELVGPDRVHGHLEPSTASEDFAFMLQARPGCYVWLGNGISEQGYMLHNPHYDFNDEILAIGASYWVRLVEKALERRGS